ncbi:hypothetical protein RA280_23590 [Cupriavidus sp. CV2]|uniref:hypothetical protein n=1 Tax=Cupriavidus ulmosensis TaxID=3065913 RepID=UPI00296B1F57|nr:hypothetical protein [Cupriavidus sp. CV2]MDW3684675.1 hypothetical protein [Cupriavidus sp. CV2]
MTWRFASTQLRHEAIREIDEAMASTSAEETAAHARFEGLIKEAAPEVDAATLWSRFENDYLYPLISKSGANTLNLISGGATEFPTEGLGPVMETVSAEVREQVMHHRSLGSLGERGVPQTLLIRRPG